MNTHYDIKNLFLKLHVLSFSAVSFNNYSKFLKPPPTQSEIQNTFGACLLAYFINKHRSQFRNNTPLVSS